MSAWIQLFIFTFIDLLWIISANDFICTDNYCKCLDPTGCSAICKNGFCQNKEFICTKDINDCLFNCNQDKDASCENSTFYIASNDFHMNCNGTDSCNNIEVYCGRPQQLPIQTYMTDFTHDMQTCAISASNSAIRNSYISCDGNIKNCYIKSETNSPIGAIFDTEFDCSVTNGQCEFNCSYGCYRSLYSCHIKDISECICNDCIQENGVTISNTEYTDYTQKHINTTINLDLKSNKKNSNIFDFTDSKISNLDILYYIILGATGCLCCYIFVCVSIICFIRSSVKHNNRHKSMLKSIHSMGKNKANTMSSDIGSSDSNETTDSIININSSINSSDVHSTHSNIHTNTGINTKMIMANIDEENVQINNDKISDHDDTSITDDECEYKISKSEHSSHSCHSSHSGHSKHFKIQLTKPIHNKRRKKSVSKSKSKSKSKSTTRSKSGHSHLSKVDKHLTPTCTNIRIISNDNNNCNTSAVSSSMSSLSTMSMSNSKNNINSGTTNSSSSSNSSMDSMDQDISISSGDSSEMNLKCKTLSTELKIDDNKIGFLKPKEFNELIQNYHKNVTSNINTHKNDAIRNTATQFAKIQEQLLYIQQQNNKISNHNIIKPSLKHKHKHKHKHNHNNNHKIKESNPKLTIIHSNKSINKRSHENNYGSNAMSDIDINDIVNNNNSHKSVASDDNCSCNDTPTTATSNGSNASSVSSSSSSSSSSSISSPSSNPSSTTSSLSSHNSESYSDSDNSNSECNDTQCSCNDHDDDDEQCTTVTSCNSDSDNTSINSDTSYNTSSNESDTSNDTSNSNESDNSNSNSNSSQSSLLSDNTHTTHTGHSRISKTFHNRNQTGKSNDVQTVNTKTVIVHSENNDEISFGPQSTIGGMSINSGDHKRLKSFKTMVSRDNYVD